MGILFDNPMLRRECLNRLRVSRWKGRSWVVAWLVITGVTYCYAIGLTALLDTESVNYDSTWTAINYFMLTMAVMLGPTLTVSAISLEREQQTWESLTLTKLTALQVYVGKWLGRQAPAFIAFIALLPLLIVCGLTKGLDFPAIFCVWFYVVMNSAFFSAVGLLFSANSRKTGTATMLTYVFAAILCIGTSIAARIGSAVVGSAGAADTTLFLDWMNPYVGMDSLLRAFEHTLNGTNGQFGYRMQYSPLGLQYNPLGVDYGPVSALICTIIEVWAICAILFWLTGRFRAPGGLNRT